MDGVAAVGFAADAFDEGASAGYLLVAVELAWLGTNSAGSPRDQVDGKALVGFEQRGGRLVAAAAEVAFGSLAAENENSCPAHCAELGIEIETGGLFRTDACDRAALAAGRWPSHDAFAGGVELAVGAAGELALAGVDSVVASVGSDVDLAAVGT